MDKRKLSVFSFIIAVMICFDCSIGSVFAIEYKPLGKWYDTVISAWSDAGLIYGDKTGNFRPDDFVTRGEFIALINRALEFDSNGDNVFEDISEKDWYYNDIITAYNLGYLKGSSEKGKLYARAQKYITRQEAVTILYRLFSFENYENGKDIQFIDSDDLSDYARDAVEKLASLGFVKGYKNNSFKPLKNISRAETLSLISNVCGEIYGKLPDVFSNKNITLTKSADLEKRDFNKMFIIAKNDIEIKNAIVKSDFVFGSLNNDKKELKILQSEIQRIIIADNSDLFVEDSKVIQADIFAKCSVYTSDSIDGLFVMNNSEVNIKGSYNNISVISRGKINLIDDSTVQNLNVYSKAEIEISNTAIIKNISISKDGKDTVLTGNIDKVSFKSADNQEVKIVINNKIYKLLDDKLLAVTNGTSSGGRGGGSGSSNQGNTEQTSETTSEETIESSEETTEQDIQGAYISKGFLYVKTNEDIDTLEVHKKLDSNGNAVSNVFTDIKINGKNKFDYKKLALYSADDIITFSDGKYEISYKGRLYPVVSVLNYRVDSGKRTVNTADPEFNNNKISFCDYVYPIIFNNNVYDNIKFEIIQTKESSNFSNMPKILIDGVDEVVSSQALKVTYPKEANTNSPKVFYDEFPVNPSSMNSLDQKDKLTIKINNDIADILYWDHISKIWYEENKSDFHIDMVYVEGGSYLRGDWRTPQEASAYTYGTSNMNIKKLWLNILDPQYMGEDARGKDAVGVTGLRNEDSLASDPNCDIWVTNDDSRAKHNVTVSDFMLGKYEVTMNQFYSFVDNLKVTSPSALSYTISGESVILNEVASTTLYSKKNTVKDNGWGKGSRPAIDINWYEAVEFCNYMSLQEGLEPCYTFTNIFNGKERDGKTSVKFIDDISGSVMQKGAMKVKDVQLVKVDCDFDKNGYRLPTESEYEYAARGGKYISDINSGKGYLYSGTVNEDCKNNSYYSWQRTNIENPQLNGDSAGNLQLNNMGGNGYTSPVGSLLPNVLGIYDLSGNVWETTWDFYNQSYYASLQLNDNNIDPRGPQYSVVQLSNLKGSPVDTYMNGVYQYGYSENDDGSFIRRNFLDVSNAGKMSHAFRGGCFTNPYVLTTTVNRYSPTQIYVQNCINFTDSRIGFRVARTVKDEDKSSKVSVDKENEIKDTIKKIFMLFNSPNDVPSEKIENFFDLENILIKYPDNDPIDSEKKFKKWVENINRKSFHYHNIDDFVIKKSSNNGEYAVEVNLKFYNSEDLSSVDATKMKYLMTLMDSQDGLKIKEYKVVIIMK